MTSNTLPVAYHYQWLRTYDPKQPTLVLLHGFTGTGQTFQEAPTYLSDVNLLTVDVIGHGQTESPTDLEAYGMPVVCQHLTSLMAQLGLASVHVLGYSMGARLALAWAVAEPRLVASVILESGSPGLQDQTERSARKKADEALARRIEKEGIPSFVAYWETLPLFATQKKLPLAKQEGVRQERLSQSPIGLSNSLRGMGTGQQPSFWEALVTLTQPVYCLTGDLDLKFCQIAQEMTSKGPTISHDTLPQVGHCLHLEAPVLFYQSVASFLKKEGNHAHLSD